MHPHVFAVGAHQARSLRPNWSPVGVVILVLLFCYPEPVTTLGIHHVQVAVAGQPGAEGDPLAIRRPVRRRQPAAFLRQPDDVVARRGHAVNVGLPPALAREGHERPAGCPRRIPAVRPEQAGHAPHVGTVRVHHEDLSRALTRRNERDFAPVRRPRRVRIHRRLIGQAARVAAVGVHHVNFRVAVPLGHKRNPRPVGRPGRVRVRGRVVRQAVLVAAIRVHDIDFRIAIARGEERDLAAARRPGRAAIQRRVVRQAARVAAVGVDDVNLRVAVALRREGHFPTVVGRREERDFARLKDLDRRPLALGIDRVPRQIGDLQLIHAKDRFAGDQPAHMEHEQHIARPRRWGHRRRDQPHLSGGVVDGVLRFEDLRAQERPHLRALDTHQRAVKADRDLEAAAAVRRAGDPPFDDGSFRDSDLSRA